RDGVVVQGDLAGLHEVLRQCGGEGQAQQQAGKQGEGRATHGRISSLERTAIIALRSAVVIWRCGWEARWRGRHFLTRIHADGRGSFPVCGLRSWRSWGSPALGVA